MVVREQYLELHEEGPVPVARLLGVRLDEPWVESLQSQLTAAMRRGEFKLCLNLAEAEFLPSRVLALIVRLHQMANDHGGTLYVSNVQPGVQKAFDITQLHRLLHIFETEEDALREAYEPKP